MYAYAIALLKNDQPKDAEPVLRECLSNHEEVLKKGGDSARLIAYARSVLGECLTKLTQFAEAEALVVESADALQEDYAASESDKAAAIQRVVDLYEAWNTAEPGQGYDVKANEWRARLPAREEEQADGEESDQ